MSRHKHKLRFIGIFLSVILSVSSVPLYAFASGTYDTGGAAAEEVTVSCEYVAKRGEYRLGAVVALLEKLVCLFLVVYHNGSPLCIFI